MSSLGGSDSLRREDLAAAIDGRGSNLQGQGLRNHLRAVANSRAAECPATSLSSSKKHFESSRCINCVDEVKDN